MALGRMEKNLILAGMHCRARHADDARLASAHHGQRLLDEQCAASVAETAEAEGIDSSPVHRLMRPTPLAPDVVEALVGQSAITVEKVLGHPWPYGWREQARLLSSAPQSPPL